MADDLHYSSGADSNKRKYEDSEVRVRRPTGFSSPIPSPADLPVSGIDAAKQRAQEIASRLFHDAEAKRPKFDNGGGGFDSPPLPFPSAPKPIPTSAHVANTTSSHQDSYGYQGMTKKIDVPNGRVGVIIGKSGETIKYLQAQSGAKIQVTRDMDADPNSPTRAVELVGTPDQIAKAEQLISEVLAEAEAGGSSRRGQAGSDQFSMMVPSNKVGLVIGKGGEKIKSIQASTGARVQVIPLHPPPGDTSTERTVQIDGSAEQIEAAKILVNEAISENRMRNSSMGGGYCQQGYQARVPQRWASGPPQMQQQQQQSAYGYTQPGAYPGPQYGAPQPQYPGYPQQTGAAGYPNSWDQSSTAPAQQPPQGTGYDYYNQAPQQQQASGADNSYYNYSQPPTSGYNSQSYPQDAYGGGYHTTKPPTDGHTSSYASQGQAGQAPPPTQTSPLGQQGYNMNQQLNPNSGYPAPGSSQPGYAVPPTSQPAYGNQPPTQGDYATGYGGPPPTQGHKPSANPPAYGQPQLSPSQGYANPQAYGQPDPAAARALPPTSYGAPPAQPGAYPAYSAPAATATYGQQPPAYVVGSYGGPYSQAAVYPAGDGNAGSNGAAGAGASPAADPNVGKAAAPESK